VSAVETGFPSDRVKSNLTEEGTVEAADNSLYAPTFMVYVTWGRNKYANMLHATFPQSEFKPSYFNSAIQCNIAVLQVTRIRRVILRLFDVALGCSISAAVVAIEAT
jgi:hypothetical protein